MWKRYGISCYLFGAATARTGDEMSGPALLLLGLAVTDSASAASALLAAITVAAAVGGPMFGVLLDRAVRPGRLLAFALAVYGTGLVVILSGLGHIPLPVVLAIALVVGLFAPALAGGWTSQLPRVTTPSGLPRASTLDAMTFNVASLTGPALAGAVAALLGATASVTAAVLLIAVALPFAWTLPAGDRSEAPAGQQALSAQLVAGFAVICRIRPLARATLTSTIAIAGEGMLVACSPLIGKQVFGSENAGVYLLSTLAAGSLVANTVLARRPGSMHRDPLILYSTVMMGAAILLAATMSPILLFVAVAILGAGAGLQLSALFTVRHRESPEHLRGQIFTTGASLKITSFALGVGAAGPIISYSIPGALITATAVEVLAVLSYLAIKSPEPSRAADLDQGTDQDLDAEDKDPASPKENPRGPWNP